MASLIEELITVLEQEKDTYGQLVPISEDKTKIIVKNDLQALQGIIEQEQLLLDRISILEHKRKEIVQNIGTVINKKPETLNIKIIIHLLEKQPTEQKRLSELHDNLKKTVQRLIEINNHNKSLIQQSLEMIEFDMNFIQSTRMSPGNQGYTKGAAQFDIPYHQQGMFDAKQ